MSHYYPEFHGVPQEAHSGEASVKEKVWEAEGNKPSAASISNTYIIRGAFVLWRTGSLCSFEEGSCIWVVSI